jgi:hypothetical protein
MNVFISYSHKDRAWCDRLAVHLSGISKDVVTEVWYDSKITPGSDWDAEIQRRLGSADIVILLISENFLGAKFCRFEVERALQLREANKCVIVPVLLSHCVYQSLALGTTDPSPHGGEPIDAPAWRDKSLALATVTREVETVARVRRGMPERRKGLSVDIEALRTLLHSYCDREPQRVALHEILVSKYRKSDRPCVIIVYGHAADCLNWYLFRVRNVILKRYFPHSISELTPLQWPDEAGIEEPFSIFGAGLSDSFSVSPYASVEEINQGLCALSRVNVLPSWIPAHVWDRDMEAVFLAYLRLWEAWPRLPLERSLFPVALIEYKDREDINPRILRFLKKIDQQIGRELKIVMLGLQKVTLWDFQQWLRLNEVKEKIPDAENAVAQSHLLGDVPKRIYDLSQTDLPRFLGGLQAQ